MRTLSTYEQQLLDEIEAHLTVAAPRLARQLARPERARRSARCRRVLLRCLLMLVAVAGYLAGIAGIGAHGSGGMVLSATCYLVLVATVASALPRL